MLFLTKRFFWNSVIVKKGKSSDQDLTVSKIKLYESKFKKALKNKINDKEIKFKQPQKIKDNSDAVTILNNGKIFFKMQSNNLENYENELKNNIDNFEDSSVTSVDKVDTVINVQQSLKNMHVILSIESDKCKKKLESNFKTKGKSLITLHKDEKNGECYKVKHDVNQDLAFFEIKDIEDNSSQNFKKVAFDEIDEAKTNIFVNVKKKLGNTESEAKDFIFKTGSVIVSKFLDN